MSTGDGASIPSTPSRSGSSAVLAALGTPKSRHDKSPVSTPERPRKRIKLEEKPAVSKEIEEVRHAVHSSKLKAMQTHKNVYRENLLELFFLQNMGNIMDYFIWRKKPDVKVYQFLKSGQIDSDDEEWYSERSVLSEGLALAGSIVSLNQSAGSLSTPQFSAQGSGDQRRTSKLFGQPSASPKTQGSNLSQSMLAFEFPGDGEPNIHGPGTSSNDTRLSGVIVKTEGASSSTTTSSGISGILANAIQSPGVGPVGAGSSSAVPESITGTQEAIVERAKQEAAVMHRVSELRRDGLWSSRRLPKVQEPSRGKAHWDYLLEEMQWLAADFAQERKWKKAGARKIASMISKYHKERQMKEIKAEKDEANRTRRIASNLAKMVREFWGNIEKIVEYKYQSRLEEKRKKAMDLHLSFIVDQTEKYSSWLTEGLATGTPDPSSTGGSPTRSAGSDDRDFEPSDNDEDDEETIRIEEMEAENEDSSPEELAELQKEMELPIEELLRSLPQEVLDKPASIAASDSSGSDKEGSPTAKKRKLEDSDFGSDEEDSADDEETLEKEEEQEGQDDAGDEMQDLQQEGEMTLEELRKKYAGAYDSDFEMPEDSTPSDTEAESECLSSEEDEEEEEVEEEVGSEKEEDVGMEYLMKDLGTSKPPAKKDKDIEPGSDLTDIAATAESIQPTGYTLETTKVRTAIPFLLKHTLREYQVVGLDWMATMYDRRLNGILADEMGLGKTIQTIALLAHLACEKGIWGPHLIVVPTSVMLNWEMEIKKWCPAFKILTYFGTQKERKAKRTGWTKTNAFHVCITSYKLVIQDHQAFRRKKWKYFILDEAQNIKNFKSQRWQTLLNFASQRRLLLTGTPLQNSLMELWSLMHFLMPHVFQSHKDFKEWFANPLTGMIEGSREYNENLIKRLHKVLRPFLLRRLKIDVEKQMPKKYEHIVKCHLSRRQRFLYDDFMSQTKTKETLASGHYMSVINILMQLRKVCNHPNLFDARPIVSPFQMEGITYTTASIVTKALHRDPLEYIAPTDFHPSLADLELFLPAFVAHRIRQLQTPHKLIEEIDSQPDPPARPPPADRPVKLLHLSNSSPMPPGSGRASPFVPIQHRAGSPLSLKSPLSKSPASTPTPVTTPSVETTQLHQLPGHTPQIKTSNPTTSTPTSVMLSSASSTSSTTSQPITVQIQNTPQGTRLMIPSGQLSQLPGYIQIVQTSSGQQIIATSQPPPNQSSGTTVVNGPGSSAFTMAGQSVKTTSAVQLPLTSVVPSKPVMKVSPLINTPQPSPGVGNRLTSPLSPKSVIGTRCATRTLPGKAKEKSVFFMESMHEKRSANRRDKLLHMGRANQHSCDLKPVYGLDLRDSVHALTETKDSANSRWHGLGYVHCHKVHSGNPNHPSVFWRQTDALRSLLHTPEQYLHELHDILDRFTFAVPAVRSPSIRMRTFHPSPPTLQAERQLKETLHTELAPKAKCLHGLVARMCVQFPEVRLIQYDCGKLQTLDLLLRQLKSGDHRVLIFTQMTKMLDVLEAFLNFHGHRYLRLDGTTKVEQRQALMERFNADRRIFVFILSTRSGGLGVNLTGADTVIFYDSDWNPTMDAQAQDRCHRIGQTRDVHIYRLISEKTIEENILKKANQKRLLSDVTIEGGNFTTAFFKENTIKELFEEPSGLEAFVQDKNEADAKAAALKQKAPAKESAAKSSAKPRESKEGSLLEESVKEVTRSRPPSRASSKAGSLDQEHLEQVLCTAEDEGDVQAAKTAKAEQSAELAEFDEDIPWDEKEAEQKQQRDQEMSRVEQELSMLDKELTPVERYAVCHMEVQLTPLKLDELEKAEEDVTLAKEEWEFSRLKALKEEEERRAELEEDEMLFTYSREDASNQVYVCDETGEQMPMWCPPTPPQAEQDVYVDVCLYFLYEQSVMPETQLPPVYIKKEHKRVRVDPAIVTRKNKTRKEEQARVPKSLFDRPTSLLRRDTKLKLKQSFGLKPLATRPTLTRPLVDSGPEHPEWLIHEDWALLQAVQNLLELPLALSTSSPGHIPNWDLVADIVNTTSRTYRSAKQCRSRYENVIVPREEGRILYDVNPRKQKKTKSIYKVYHTKNNRPMRTSQLYAQDNHQSLSTLFTLRFDSSKSIASKRTPTLRPTLANPTLKNPKHAAVLGENGINYEQPLTPTDVAQIRADRITKEKKEQQLAGQKSQASTSGTSTTAVSAPVTQTATVVTQAIGGQPQLTVVQGHPHLQAVATGAGTTIVVVSTAAGTSIMPAGTLQKTSSVSAASVSLPKGLAAAAVVNTAGGVPANALASINRKLGQTVVGSLAHNVSTTATLSGSALSQGVRVAPARTYVQEISAAIAQARTSAGTLVTTVSQAQLPRVALTASTVAPGKAAGQPQITTTSKLTQHHLRILQQKQQQYKQQQQQRTNLSALQTSQAAVVQAVQQRPTTVATVATPLITSISGTAATRLQVPKQTITQQNKPRAMTEAEMAALLRQQQKGTQKIQTLSGANQLTTAQLLSAGQQVQSQSGPGGGVATLVKTVSTQGGASSLPSVTIPVSAVGLGITVPQKQGGRMTQMQVRQLMSQKGRTMTAAQLQTHKATLGQIQVPKSGGGLGTPLIIPQKHANQQVIVQQIQQIVKQQAQSTGQPQTVQQLITAASSNAATVLVTQAGQPVARLSVPSATTTVQARGAAPHSTAQQTLLTQPASSSTLTLQPASLVKNLQEVVVSPAKQLKTLPVSTATLRSIPGLTLAPGQTGTVNIQQIQQAKAGHAPSAGVQQAVQQVVQQAQAQAQQRHLHATTPASPSVSTLNTPTATQQSPLVPPQSIQHAVSQQALPVQQSATSQSIAIQQAVTTTTAQPASTDQKSPYSTRLRTTKQ